MPDLESALSPDLAESYFNGTASFVKGCVEPSHFPEEAYPEVAFIGRSNVGKSSLINALLNRKSLARTSNTPGRTREINYFLLTPPAKVVEQLNQTRRPAANGLYIVDLPGYGYAKHQKDFGKQWQKLCSAYISERGNLRRVYVLIDSRHGIKDTDLQMTNFLDHWGVSYQLILTKADKLSTSGQQSILEQVSETVVKSGKMIAAYPKVLQVSSSKKTGFEALKKAALEVCLNG
jgi:GTP-binding protein